MRGRALAVAVVLACLTVVVLLGVGVRMSFRPELRLDTVVSSALYAGDGRSPWLNGLLQVLTAPGLALARYAIAIPVLVFLFRRRAWRTALWVVVAISLISPLTTAIKEGVGRLRPQFANGGAHYTSMSFPSGHSSGIATAVTVGLVLAWPLLTLRARRLWLILGVALVVLVGLTRMWLGVHYLSDVVAGWALGVGWALLVALAFGGLPGGPAALTPRR